MSCYSEIMGQIVFALVITICEGWDGDDWIDIKKV